MDECFNSKEHRLLVYPMHGQYSLGQVQPEVSDSDRI